MKYDIVKFERGQLWMVRFKHPQENVGHEQQKDRPYLVLSVGKFNKSSGMVTMVPVTTRDNIVTPSQVQFINDRGYSNVILCEGIRTFDYKSGAYIFDFLGQISDDILEKVDVALSIHLGLHYSPITLKKLYDSMEAIIKSIGHMQQKADTPKFTDNDVLEFAEKLQSLAGAESSIASEELAATVEIPKRKLNPHQSPLDEYRGHPVEYVEVKEESPKAEEKKPLRIRWTPEKCQEFLDDDNNMPMSKVMEKWNISKKTRYYSMKNYVENLMTKTT